MIIVPIILVIILLLWWIIEYHNHLNNVKQIPIRIHINGTRGKSSVTRLITWGLMGGRFKVVSKTTGSAPVLIINGIEEPVIRISQPNIKEQLSAVNRAVEENAQTLVIECMAVDPELQYIAENKIVKSTIGVITNVRPDHLESMGQSMEKIADALSGTIPRNAILFTAEKDCFNQLEKNAEELNTKIILVSPDSITDDEMNGFSYIEHKENVALSLAVCEYVGVKKDIALKSMWNTIPDIGAMKIYEIDYYNHKIFFVNIFAANDPVSTITAYKKIISNRKSEYPIILIVNNRADRLDRLLQYEDILGDDIVADYYIIAGAGGHQFTNSLISKGINENNIIDMGNKPVADIFEKVLAISGNLSVVIGVGNIGGTGQNIVDYFSSRGKECRGLP